MSESLSFAVHVHDILCKTYHCPIAYFHTFDPLSELVSSILSHRTRNHDSGRAFKELKRQFPSWELVRDAPTEAIEKAISACTWPELKAPRIQKILRQITEERGELSLEFLNYMEADAARGWLERFDGVGPKTSAAVLSFSMLRKATLPVDSHHHRVATRLGMIPANTPLARAHVLLASQLPKDWDAQTVYDNHEVMMIHGQRCCFFRGPACHRCPLLNLCPTGKVRTETSCNHETPLDQKS